MFSDTYKIIKYGLVVSIHIMLMGSIIYQNLWPGSNLLGLKFLGNEFWFNKNGKLKNWHLKKQHVVLWVSALPLKLFKDNRMIPC